MGEPAGPHPARRGRIDVGDVTLAVTQRGDPAHPTVVLVHGYPDTQAVWDELAALLAGRFQVVSYDVRGAGGSTAPGSTAGYALPRLVTDLEAVIREVSPGRPVHLVGHDWGSLQCWEAVSTPRLAGRVASFTSMCGPSIDHAAAWLLRRALRGPGGAADLAGQLARSWYIGFFQLPVLPELAWRGLGRHWGRLMAAEGSPPRPGHPAGTIIQDGVNGLSLYRVNMPRRMTRPRPARADVPVQVIVASGDRYIAEQTQLSARGYATRLWLRRTRAPPGSSGPTPRSWPGGSPSSPRTRTGRPPPANSSEPPPVPTASRSAESSWSSPGRAAASGGRSASPSPRTAPRSWRPTRTATRPDGPAS